MTKLMIFLVKRLFFFVPRSVSSMLCFETISFVRRMFARPLVLDRNRKNYINLGSGAIRINGLINIDFFATSGIDYGADLRYPLKIEGETVDGIFTEHTLEHLVYQDVDKIINECYRILKPNGVIRIVLPDLSLFIRNYCEENSDWFDKWEKLIFIDSSDPERARRRLLTKLQAISFVTQEYGHQSAWDFATLEAYLAKSGFREISRTTCRQGRCEELLIDLDDEERTFVSLYVEAVK